MGILVIGSAKESSQIKQIIGLGLSLVVMVVASLVDYTWLLKLQWLMYAGSIAILAAVIFFGKEVNGSRRWFEIPHIGLTFQPAELVKILMILFFAKFFMDHQEELQQKNRTVLIAVGTGGAAFASRVQAAGPFHDHLHDADLLHDDLHFRHQL